MKDQDLQDEFLSINLLELDKEVSIQPKLYHKWANKKAVKAAELEDAKDALELLSAKIKDKIRRKPTIYNIEGRVTNDAVDEKLLQQEEYQEAKAKVNELKLAVDKIKAVVDSLEQKKWMIGNAIELWQGEYYSDAKPKGAEDAIDKMRKEKIKERRKKKRESEGSDD